MAIGTDAVITFTGTQDDVTTSSASVADGVFSIASDTSEWVNDDDAPMAAFALEWQHASGTVDAGGIGLYMQMIEIVDTDKDEPIETVLEPHFLGKFPTDANMATATRYYVSLGHYVDLPNIQTQSATAQKYVFYIKSDCNVTIDSGWNLWVTPVAFGPHA